MSSEATVEVERRRYGDSPPGRRRDDRSAPGVGVAVAGFVVIELRSRAPLLPVRIVRVANATMAVVGAATFAQFFLLTFYIQEVFRYSGVQTGVGFAARRGAMTSVVIDGSGTRSAGRIVA